MRKSELNEDATIFIGQDEVPVYEGRLLDALRYATETMRVEDRDHCHIMTLSGDRYGPAEIETLRANVKLER
jgi:hypothetical protein